MLMLSKATRKSLMRGVHIIMHDLLGRVSLVYLMRHLSFHSPAMGAAHQVQNRGRCRVKLVAHAVLRLRVRALRRWREYLRVTILLKLLLLVSLQARVVAPLAQL